MPIVIFVTLDGKEHEIEAEEGATLMEIGRDANLGIEGTCGGSLSCATCHVYIKEDWINKIPKKEDGEDDMLDMAFEPNKLSRLSCQIIVSDELEGLVVNLPAKQS